MTSRASGIFIVQPGWCSLPKKFLSSCSSGITDWRLRLIFQISTCVLQISGKEVEFAFCLKALLFSPCCISCSHLQAGRCSVLHNDCSPSSCTKPQIITSWIYINWKRQKAASFLPFFLYFWFFFPFGQSLFTKICRKQMWFYFNAFRLHCLLKYLHYFEFRK